MPDLKHQDDDWTQEPHPEPIPVPPPGAGPIPVPPPAPRRVEEDEPIALVDLEDWEKPAADGTGVKKRVAGAEARGLTHKVQFNRPMNITGQGATRVRLFYSKIADGPLLHMENTINEWIDEEKIEVKHVGHVIGTLEGKRAEPNLIIVVWY